MRIGIDCLSVSHDYVGGANTFLHGIISGIIDKLDSLDHLIIFCPKEEEIFSVYAGRNVKIVQCTRNNFIKKILFFIPFLLRSPKLWKTLHNLYATYFTNIKAVMNKECDILYCPNTSLNIYSLDVPIVLSMHDIQHVHYPENFSSRELRSRLTTYGANALAADYMQASSEFMKADFLSYFGKFESKNIRKIREGVDLNAFNCLNVNQITNCTRQNKKYFLFPAQIWHHKNHMTVLNAIKILNERNREVKLILTGAKYSGWSKVETFLQHNKELNIEYLGVVSFEKLSSLYADAFAVISPAVYESSSLPILEAIASKSIVVASNTNPNHELSEIFDIKLFETLNPQSLANILETLLDSDEGVLEEERIRNIQRLQPFGWDAIGEKYVKWFREIYTNEKYRSDSTE